MDRLTARNRAAFLVGCLAGCLLSSMFYVWWSGLFVTNGRFQAQLIAPLSLQLSNGFFSRQSDRPWTLASELRSKKRLLVAVLTSRDRLNETVAMANETLASQLEPTVDYAIFVAGEGPAMPGVYWMSRVQDFEQDGGNLEHIFHVLKYLYSSFVRHYSWFLLASENTYIAVRDLEKMLSGLDASKPVYMGRLASEDTDVMAMLHLLPNEYYCQWGPGIMLSNAALTAVAEHLDGCKSLAAAFGARSSHVSLERGDVELGRCFSRRLGIQCTSSREVSSPTLSPSFSLPSPSLPLSLPLFISLLIPYIVFHIQEKFILVLKCKQCVFLLFIKIPSNGPSHCVITGYPEAKTTFLCDIQQR